VKPQIQKKIRKYFERIPEGIFSRGDLSDILDQNRVKWDALEVSTPILAKFLVDKNLLTESVFTSAKYRPIVRYIRGAPSPYLLALSLRKGSFLCHQSALELHGFDSSGEVVYVNREQAPKVAPGGMTQRSIDLAFKTPQRRSNYVFDYAGYQYVLVAGKNTGNAGVVEISRQKNGVVVATDLERTLIDIVVRPAYAGGVERVFRVYAEAARNVNISHMTEILKTLDYAYPYHQSIGFLLERAGLPEADYKNFRKLGTHFDFHLDYGLKHPAYDSKWHLYYPRSLDVRGRG
jgi:predicted transcriptional regulator of viral defense system